jgi:hypothetical protein
MSPSRRDALDRVRHFEQLANGQTFSSNFFEEKQGTIKKDTILKEPNNTSKSNIVIVFELDIAL